MTGSPSASAELDKQPVVTELRFGEGQQETADPTPCGVEAYGHKGRTLCPSQAFAYDWGGGNIEYFVVGTNYAIYHIWKNSGGWKSLGGTSNRHTVVVRDAREKGKGLGAWTIGTDGNCWWRPRGDHGEWPGSWRRC
ncbi:hypothetical protein ACFRCG_03485 [Embleya sp. NPDC056575]|uniref:hypothetical protein n=1 Tax=unclassified Embleya TaxID=2699296 RepID=UPI00368E28A7